VVVNEESERGLLAVLRCVRGGTEKLAQDTTRTKCPMRRLTINLPHLVYCQHSNSARAEGQGPVGRLGQSQALLAMTEPIVTRAFAADISTMHEEAPSCGVGHEP
jgi:hypothetical protein